MAGSQDGGISRRRMLSVAAAAGVGLVAGSAERAVAAEGAARKAAQKSVFGLRHPAMGKVRVGMIGMGGRGSGLLGNLLDIEKVEIRAVCDVVGARVAQSQRRVVEKGQAEPAGFAKGETDFENLCKRDDVDVVYIATPWEWHTPMAVCAMKNGKHAAVEVPAAMTVEECWELVDRAEETQRHCMMLENCCYGEMEMMVLSMVRQGVLGELTHGEAAYIHNLADFLMSQEPSAVWRRRHGQRLDGNLYPTHGLGPIAQYMGINAGDKFEYLVSMSSAERTMSMLRDRLGAGDGRRGEKYACGDVNTTLIRTARGRSIMLQYDVCTPRPYSRINMICGTGGTFCDYPPRIHLRGKGEGWETEMRPYEEKYGHPLWKKLKEWAAKSGGHGGMDYVMNWRLMQCLLEGEALDMTVYDGAAWSSVLALSVESVAGGSVPVRAVDFTRGGWKDRKAAG